MSEHNFAPLGRCTCTPITNMGVMVQHPDCAVHGVPRVTFTVESRPMSSASAAPPESSLPLSAIRALIQRWEGLHDAILDDVNEGYGTFEEAAYVRGVKMCAKELAALCPAPAAEEEKSRTS